jgi:heme exporter protein B
MSDTPLPTTRPRPWRTILAIFWKDLAIEIRRRQLLTSLLVFAVLILFIFNFALDLQARLRTELVSGIIWAAVVFSGAIGFDYTMSVEQRSSGLDAFRLAPIRGSWFFLGKLMANTFFLLLVELLLLPISSILFGLNLMQPLFLLVLLLGTIGYSAAGTLFSVMSVRTRTRELMLPLLLFPLALPLLIPAVQAGAAVLLCDGYLAVRSWINLLIGYDILLLTSILLLIDAVIEE